MPPTTVDNLILNTPFDEPTRHRGEIVELQ